MSDTDPLVAPEASSAGRNAAAVLDEEIRGKRNIEPAGPYRVTIEPAFAAVFFASFLSDAVLTQLFLKRCCLVELHLNTTVCEALGSDTALGHWAEEHVQPFAADYLMWKLMLQSIVPVFLSLFLGAWTDKHGRKPVLVFSTAGMALMYTAYLVLAYLPSLPPAYLLLAIVPSSCMGGIVNLISAGFSFMSDNSPPEKQSSRMGLLEASVCLGILAGLELSPVLYAATESRGGFGHLAIFGASAVVCLGATIYLAAYVTESVGVTEASTGFCGLFDLQLPVNMFKTCFRTREGHRRVVILASMAILSMAILSMEGESQVFYLFTRLRFSWNLSVFNQYSAIFTFVATCGIPIGTWLLPAVTKDVNIIALAVALSIGQCVVIIIAKPEQEYLMYVSIAFGFMRGAVSPLIRAIISQTVSKTDVGSVFAMNASLEALMPLAAAPLYVPVYNATIDSLPAAFLLLSVAIYIIQILLALVIGIIRNNHQEEPEVSNPEDPPVAIEEQS